MCFPCICVKARARLLNTSTIDQDNLSHLASLINKTNAHRKSTSGTF